MAAENILGKLIIEGANRAGGIAGGTPSLGSGLAGGGGGTSTRSAEMETRGFQKTVKDAQVKAVGFAKEQPKWWTRMFKTLGIQMGLAGILKQSQVFTSTIGAMFQIFGAMVDVMLVPLVKPVLMPVMRWLARQIPTMGRLSKAIFGFIGSTIMGLIRVVKKIGEWTSGFFAGFLKIFTGKFWGDAFKGTIAAMETIPGKIKNAITSLFSWSTWENIFRSLWNATLGGARVGTDRYGFTFPTWGGGSTWKTEGAGTKSETLVTIDEDTGKVLSYESDSTIESAFKTGLDKKGNVLQEKYGVDNKRTGNVLLGAFEWMNQPPEGGTPRTLSGYEKYRDAWKANRTGERNQDLKMKSAKEFVGNTVDAGKEVAGDLKGKFDELNIALKAALLLVGGQVSGMILKDLTGTVARAMSLVVKGVSTPARAIKGVIYGIGKSFANPLKEASFYRQLGKGGGVPGALGRTVSSWQLGFQPNKVADVASDLGSGSRPPTGTAADRVLRSKLFPTAGSDLEDIGKAKNSKITSALTKARQLLAQLTSWLLNKLRNLKNLLRPNAFAQAESHLASKANEIKTLLRSVPATWPGANVQNILSRLALLKSFLARAVPLVGAAVGAVMTAKNIKTILGTDLSWFTANENTVAAQEANAQIQQSLGLASGALTEGQVLWQEGGFQNRVKGAAAMFGASILGKGAADEAMQDYMSQTKGGAILNQLLLGTATTGMGLFGAAGLPAGAVSAIAQELAMAEVRNNNQSIELYNQMLQAARAGSHGVSNEINFKIEGIDAVMEIPGYVT